MPQLIRAPPVVVILLKTVPEHTSVLLGNQETQMMFEVANLQT